MKPIEPCHQRFGSAVAVLRTMADITQQELAKSVGMTRTSITNIEAGRQRVLLDDVERFAAALGVPTAHFVRAIWPERRKREPHHGD